MCKTLVDIYFYETFTTICLFLFIHFLQDQTGAQFFLMIIKAVICDAYRYEINLTFLLHV